MFPLKDLILKLKIFFETVCNYILDVRYKVCAEIDEARKYLATTFSLIGENIRPIHTSIKHKGGITIEPNSYYEIVLYEKLANYDAAILSVRAYYDKNATNPVEIRWFYSPNGFDYETLEEILNKGQYVRLSVKPGEYTLRVIIIPSYETSVKIQFLNLDDTYPVDIYYWIRYVRWLGLHKI